MTKWRVLGSSAQLIVDPASGARGIIRHTRAEGAYRFRTGTSSVMVSM